MYQVLLHVKINCGLHSAVKGIKKNGLVLSVVLYDLAAFDPNSYWSSSMSDRAPCSGSVASFKTWQSTVSLHFLLHFCSDLEGVIKN